MNALLQEGGSDQDTISVAKCMLNKSEKAFGQLEQNMFFVENDLDRSLVLEKHLCCLRLALLTKHAEGVHLALESLRSGNCPHALWRAAAALRYGMQCLVISSHDSSQTPWV